MHHHHAVEGTEQQQAGFEPDLQCVGRLAQDAAHHLRADGEPLGIEGRRAGQDAEALAEQVQRQARAGLMAQRDVAQHRFLVHRVVVTRPGCGTTAAWRRSSRLSPSFPIPASAASSPIR